MPSVKRWLWPSALCVVGVGASPVHPMVDDAAVQIPLAGPSTFADPAAPKKLHGQFIHISDIHPDPWYIPKGRVSTQCHRKKPKKEKARAAFWGTPYSESCDSPDVLVDLTMKWLESEWADKVDFVIWTGDSARHDNDHDLPRSESEIFDLNRRTTAQMESVFTKKGVPVVPCLGNNDMYPHNIMYPGPNTVTHEYLNIWKNFIPFPSYSVFQRGAYYSVELIPGHLAAISLNTLYWYDSNKAVDGCRGSDPGRLELDWLEVQLNEFRRRKMQVWLSGHVPPTQGNYYPECYLRYAALALRFQDTVVGHLFGHMNVDHFFWLDAHELHHPPKDNSPPSRFNSLLSFFGFTGSSDFDAAKKPRYALPDTLREDFRDLPPAKNPPNETGVKINLDDYAVVNVGPSVVPAYVPSVRVFRYNVTQWPLPKPKLEPGTPDQSEEVHTSLRDDLEDDQDTSIDEYADEEDDEDSGDYEEDKNRGSKRHHGHRHGKGKIDCTKKKNKNRDECLLTKPRHASKHSPSRSNKLWSPLGYTQWFLPELDQFNSSMPPQFEIEYMTYPLAALVPPTDWPVPQRLLPASLQNLTDVEGIKTDLLPYEMKDLTIPQWIKLARRLGKKKRLWKRFKSAMYLGGDPDK